MRTPQKSDSFATLTRSTAGAFFLALALFCLSAMQPALAQQSFSVNVDLDISLIKGNETEPAVAINPNSSSNIFVAGVCSAFTNGGLFTTATSNLNIFASPATATWVTNIVATNLAAPGPTNLVPAYGEPSVAWDANSNLFLTYLPANFQGIAVAISTNGGASFFPFAYLATNDVTDQPRIAAGAAGTNAGPNVGNVWLVYKDYSLIGTPLVAQGLQTINFGTSVPSPIPGAGTNVTDLIGTNSMAFTTLGTSVATITNTLTNTLLLIGAQPPIILTTNTLIVAVNGTNLSTNTFNTNAGFVTTITPATISTNSTHYITNYTIFTTGISPFSSAEVIPGSVSGGFPDVAVGPSNEVMVAYQNNINSSSASGVYVNINTNVLLTNGFGAAITVTTNAIGGLTYIPAAATADGINAGVGVAWDQNPASHFYGRSYVVYSSGTSPGINIYSSYSVNNGKTWTSALQVNDDTNGNDHFFPRIALDPSTASIGYCWYDCRNDTNGANQSWFEVDPKAGSTNYYTNVFDIDGTPNDDYMVYGTISTNGGTNYLANLPMIPILTAVPPSTPAGSFTYVSETARANNANGVGHHLGLAYSAGNFCPVWPDNSTYLPLGGPPSNPGPPTNFDFYTGFSQLPTANLIIYVIESPPAPTSAEIITYTVVVTNLGPFTASSIVITNLLANNVTLAGQPTPAPGASYLVANNGQTVVFSYPSMARSTSITNFIRVTATQSGYATNIASVGCTLVNPNTRGSVTTNIVPVNGEDLALGMSVFPTNVNIGDAATYTLSVTNLGAAANGLVYITNTLPSNLAQVTNVVMPQGSYVISNNTIIFSLGTLASNQTATVTYMATTLSLGTKYQYATNLAVVTSTDFDPNLTNNTASTIITILGEDLGVSLSPSVTNVNIGDTITYTLVITNSGPSDFGIINVTNTLSTNLGQISVVQYPPAGWSGSISKNTVIFNMGELLAGDSITIIYSAVALSINASQTNAISSVVVSSTDFDTNLVNNVASATTTINGEDLAVGLSASPSPVWDGQPLTYVVTVTNLGLSSTGLISVTNFLSTNQSGITVLQSPGWFTINGNTVVFQGGTLGVGQTSTIIFTAIPTSIGTVTNSVVVGSTDFDTNLTNNSAQIATTVIVPPPPITNLNVIAYASSAFIGWSTPLPATFQVAYGLTTNYGNITSISGPSTNPVVLLTGLLRDTNYYFNVMSWENGTLYTASGSFATVDTLILNTIDASYTGSWMEGSGSLSGIYGSYFNDAYTTQFNTTATATYTPAIVTPGFYNVSVWYPQSANFTTNVPMSVSGATNEVVVTVNQTSNGGTWQPLATNLYFASGIGGNAVIYNGTGTTNKLVAANAMKWSYVDSQDYPGNNMVPAWWANAYFGGNIAAANSNYADYVFGLVPGGNPPNTPGLWAGFASSNTVAVTFEPYQGGRIYQLQVTTNLSNPNWLTLTNQPAVATDGSGYGNFSIIQSNASQYFFRLSAQLSTNY